MRRRYQLLDLDPDLGMLVPVDRRDACRRELEVEVRRLAQGPWAVGGDGADPKHAGLLVIDGVIARDVVRPWSLREAPGLLQATIRWTALTDVNVALLDRRFAGLLTHWPDVNVAIMDRINQRAHRLAITQAISQLNKVDRRLLSLFWHLAERWGRITPGGVVIPLTLSHRMLGQLVGARRPTVSSAIGELAARDELVRRDDGTWLLKGDPVGAPTGDAERWIPIRRRLFGRLPGEPLGLETS